MLVPVLFVWGRVGFGLVGGLLREFTQRSARAPDLGLELLRAVAALPAAEARSEAERALASGMLDVETSGAAPAWAGGLHPELIAFFRRYNRVSLPGVASLGGSAAGAPAFLEGYRIVGPANAEGDRYWVVSTGSPELVLSEESAVGARPLGRLAGLSYVLVWMARLKIALESRT